MALSYLLLIISIFWILSEIILSRVTYSHSEQAKTLDSSSLSFLWITIVVSTTLGIFAGTTGIGFVSYRSVIISHVGIVLILLGLIVRWWAILFLRRYFTANVSIQNDHQLITNGMYHYVRHPSYTGSLLSFFGLGIAFSNWLVTIIVFFPILFAFLQRIKIEEEVLRKHFGELYIQYSKDTYRLVPRIY